MPIATLLLLAGLSSQDALEVTNGWVREAPPGAQVMAAYGKLCNNTGDALLLTDIASTMFERIEMHETVETRERVFMRRLPTLHLAAQECESFQPGDQHFMLFTPDRPLRAGDTVTFTLRFENGDEQRIALPVRRADDMLPHHEHH